MSLARQRYAYLHGQLTEGINEAEQLIEKGIERQAGRESIAVIYGSQLLHKLVYIRRILEEKDKRATKTLSLIEAGLLRSGGAKISLAETVLLDELEDVIKILTLAQHASVNYALKTKRVAFGYAVLATVVAIFFVIFFLWLIIRQNISRPLHILTDTINAFSALGKVEEIAERANQAKSQFLAAASHDLRQPLHAMQMYIAALRHVIVDRKVLSIVEDIDAVSISTARLLNARLDVSQLKAGIVKPQYDDFPVQEILHRVARAFEPTARQKELDLRFID